MAGDVAVRTNDVAVQTDDVAVRTDDMDADWMGHDGGTRRQAGRCGNEVAGDVDGR